MSHSSAGPQFTAVVTPSLYLIPTPRERNQLLPMSEYRTLLGRARKAAQLAGMKGPVDTGITIGYIQAIDPALKELFRTYRTERTQLNTMDYLHKVVNMAVNQLTPMGDIGCVLAFFEKMLVLNRFNPLISIVQYDFLVDTLNFIKTGKRCLDPETVLDFQTQTLGVLRQKYNWAMVDHLEDYDVSGRFIPGKFKVAFDRDQGYQPALHYNRVEDQLLHKNALAQWATHRNGLSDIVCTAYLIMGFALDDSIR